MRIVDVTPYVLEGAQSYGSHTGDVEATDQGDFLLLVRVSTDEGLTGWADVETLGPVGAAVIAGPSMGGMGFRTLREILVGQDPLDIAGRWQDMYVASAYYGRRGVVMQCISAVDNCLWSIAAQAAGRPLAELLGQRRRDRLPAYASTLFRAEPDDNAAAARRYVDLGFRGVKFGWGGFGVDPARDRDNLAAVREALGPDRALMVDPGWYLTLEERPVLRDRSQTAAMLETVTAVDPYWVEDFVAPDSLGDYRLWGKEFPGLRFAAGEQQATAWDFVRLFDEGGIHVVQPDLSRCGGLTTALEVAREAAGRGVELVTHSWLTDLLHGYSLALLATLPEAPWVEFNVAQSHLSDGVTVGSMELAHDGTVAVPEGVGVGVEVDDAFVEAHTGNLRRPVAVQ